MAARVDWDNLVIDYAHGASITELASKYECSRQAIYKYFERNAVKRTFSPNLPEISRIAIDDRFAKMHVLYSTLQDIQNSVEECSQNLRRSQFQMQSLFRHMEDLRIALTDIHDTHMRKTITELRQQLRGDPLIKKVLDHDYDADDSTG